MARILVTGASGFIGRHLVPALRDAGHAVFEVDINSGDVADESTWVDFPRSDVVLHLAGKTFVPDSWADPAGFIKCNLLGTVSALNYCRRNNARLVFLSSYLYGNQKVLPIPETAPLVVNNPYGLSKKLAEEACWFFSDSFGIHVTILRLFNVYGPWQPEHFLIPSIIRQVNAGQVIRVKDLEPKRDYVYVKDVAQAILKAVDCQEGFRIFNIGSGASHSVEELIRIIQSIMKTDLPVKVDAERRKDEIMNTVADITASKHHLGWAPRWTLHRGVQHMLFGDEPAFKGGETWKE